LKDYRKKNPEVAVLDPPDAIEQLLNRQSMLNDVTNLNLSDCYGNLLLFLSSLWGTLLFQLPEL
jgi:inositol-1,3,4-trisphosphate 5/6-kinase/inositol-tetrakisphosphate 1-kinase